MGKTLSICIPCFKRLEYVRNTLDSIYNQNSEVPLEEYEVIISDNDPEKECQSLAEEYPNKNLKYFYSECEGFQNSYYALTYGDGEYLLLHNSQELFRRGSLRYVIDLLGNNPRSYFIFTSGFLLSGKERKYNSFDDFLSKASYWSSWSNAFGIWREDFKIVSKTVKLNNLFPHSSLLLTQNYHEDYIVCDKPIFDTQFVKGRSGHNKFHAFCIEFPSILYTSIERGIINKTTFDKIINDIKNQYLPLLYFNVKIAKREKWDFKGFREDLKVYFPKYTFFYIVLLSIFSPVKAFLRKIRRRFLLKRIQI